MRLLTQHGATDQQHGAGGMERPGRRNGVRVSAPQLGPATVSGSTRLGARSASARGRDGAAVSDELGERRRDGVLVDGRFAAGDRPLEEEAWRGIELPAAAPADQDWTGRQDMGDTPALGGKGRDGALVGGNDLYP